MELVATARVASERWVDRLELLVMQTIDHEADRLRRLPRTDARLQTVDLAALEARLTKVRDQIAASGGRNSMRGRASPVLESASPHDAVNCAVCEEIASALFEYLAKDQYLLATCVERQEAHAACGGFCAFHTWRYADLSSDLGMSAGYACLARDTGDKLAEAAANLDAPTMLRDEIETLLQRVVRCPACALERETERHAVHHVVRSLSVSTADTDVPTLCLVHAAAILAAQQSPSAGRRLVGLLARRLQTASEDMRSYALKRDALHREFISRDEARAYLRVAGMLAGPPSLARPKRPRDEL
jgi:hypothetical protein